jgi:hypothetical protein
VRTSEEAAGASDILQDEQNKGAKSNRGWEFE